MNYELKPCPFCGSPAKIDCFGPGGCYYYPRCTSCHCEINYIVYSMEAAAEMWNERTAP